MNYKVGDNVRKLSRHRLALLAVGPKDLEGGITGPDGCYMSPDMLDCAGHVKEIVLVADRYRLDGAPFAWWSEWMFEPADALLSAEEAVIAMVHRKEELVDDDGRVHFWNGLDFICNIAADRSVDSYEFENLHRPSVKRKRVMSRWEVLDWANSEASRGWVVRQVGSEDWLCPQALYYNLDTDRYDRARLLPDLSGVDESTIQGFEVKE
jgi:hypothetical protein